MRTASCSVRRIASSSSLRLVEATDAVQLGVAADRRHRRAQLVGRIGDEPAQPLLRLGSLVERRLERLEHVVERDAELPGLRRRRGVRHPLGEVAAGDLRRRPRHLLDRPDAEADHPPRDGGEHGEDDDGVATTSTVIEPGDRVVDVGQRERRDVDRSPSDPAASLHPVPEAASSTAPAVNGSPVRGRLGGPLGVDVRARELVAAEVRLRRACPARRRR